MFAKISPWFLDEFTEAGFRTEMKYLALIAVRFRGRVYANGHTAYRISA
jgi:hypothetical protein